MANKERERSATRIGNGEASQEASSRSRNIDCSDPARPPWTDYLGGTFTYSGPACASHNNEHLSLRLTIGRDGSFRYDTQLYDGGQGYTLESMTGQLALRDQTLTTPQGHDFVMEVRRTQWQAGSWNGEGQGASEDVKRFTVHRRGTDAMFVDKKELRRVGGTGSSTLPSSKL